MVVILTQRKKVGEEKINGKEVITNKMEKS
jgi:hypothetical protein